MKTIELHPAYSWDCDECGIENFERTVVIPLEELTDEEREQFSAKDLESFLSEDGTFQSMPNHVKCYNCETEYKTYHMFYGEDGESEDT